MKRTISIIMVMVLMLGTSSVFANSGSEIPGMDSIILIDEEEGERTWAEEKERQEEAENTFSDLGSHWGRTNIMRLYNMGGISGYPDGTVKPDGTVTRAEFLALASKTVYPEKVGKAKSGEHWGKPFFDAAVENGIMHEIKINEETWNDNITRYEMAEIIVKFLENVIGEEKDRITGVEEFMEDYDKVNSGRASMYSYYVAQAFVKGIITGRNANGLFAGDENGTRAEAATLIIRLIDINERKEIVLEPSGKVVEETNDEEDAKDDEWDWGEFQDEVDQSIENNKNGFDNGQDFELTQEFMDEYQKYSVIEINKVRAENGVEPLKHTDLAEEMAQYKSEDMYNLWKQGEDYDVYFAHESPNYGDFKNLLEKFNKKTGGENIGHHPYLTEIDSSPRKRAIEDVRGFEQSPGHFKNMINPKWTKVGFGIKYYYQPDNHGFFLVTQTLLTESVKQITNDEQNSRNFELEEDFVEEYIESQLKAVNNVRKENDVNELEVHKLALDIAQYKSEDMLDLYQAGEPSNVYFSHDSKNYGGLSDLLSMFNVKGGAENILMYPYKKDIIENDLLGVEAAKQFENSRGHFLNMIHPNWTKVGFGITYFYDEEDKHGWFLITQTLIN